MLRHRIPADADGGSQSRFSALRQFELLACDARGAVDCSQPSQFTSVFTSAADAFPSAIPRPRAPELIIRSFAVPATRATHVRLRVLTNQCTGRRPTRAIRTTTPATSPTATRARRRTTSSARPSCRCSDESADCGAVAATEEHERLEQARTGAVPWKAWGPYLSERQWGTVREDYSAGGDAWSYFSHDQARSRAYRWGEDGIAGSATSASGCASRSRCGTAPTRSSRSGCSASPTARATTARTSRSTGSTSTARRRTRT